MNSIETNEGTASRKSRVDSSVGFGRSHPATAHSFPHARMHIRQLDRLANQERKEPWNQTKCWTSDKIPWVSV